MSTPPFLARDAETTPGVASQSLVTTVLSSGRYVIASAGQSADFQRGVTVDVLAGDLGLIPETSCQKLTGGKLTRLESSGRRSAATFGEERKQGWRVSEKSFKMN